MIYCSVGRKNNEPFWKSSKEGKYKLLIIKAMNKLYAKQLSIEITRRCNMSCAHCMRGDAQNTDINHQYIKNILKNFRSIQHFNITGGEPSLNTKAMRYILKQLKLYNIHVNDFYIVTNGSPSSISKEFIDICSELYEYQEEKDENCHMLEMSDDKYHDNRYHQKVIAALKQYPFFGLREQAKYIFLFKEGRCTTGFSNPIHRIYLTSENYVYGDIYLNAEGKILSNGDLSYRRQQENILCSSSNFLKYIKNTLEKE